MRSKPVKSVKYVFLPLLALATVELAPPLEAAPGDRDSRGSSARSSGGSSRSSGSSVGRSSGGSSRSSGSSIGRSSSGSPRSSGSSIGRSSSSSSRSSGSSIGRSSSGSSRSSGSSLGSSSYGSSGRSGGTIIRSSSSSSSSSRSSGSPVVTGTSSTTSTGADRIRFTSPMPAAAPTTTAPSYTTGAAARTGGLDATGEAYAPAARPVAFPTPTNSGRTTYARRFEDGGLAGRRASTETGGTLGSRGVGSVTSAIAAERRAQAARGPSSPDPISARGDEVRVRAPHSPGARFRRGLAETASLRRAAAATETRPGSTPAGTSRVASERLRYAESAPSPVSSLRQRIAAASDPEGSKIVSTLGRQAAQATGGLVSAATRPLVGEAGSRLVSAPFVGDAYGDDYGDGYGYTEPYDEDCHWDYGFGWWDANGYYHSPWSPHHWWGWGFGWSTSWGMHLSFGWDSWDCYGWGYYPPYAYYPSAVHHYYYDEPDPVVIYEESEPVIIHIYDDDPVGEAVWVEGGEAEVVDHGGQAGRVAPAVIPAPDEPAQIGAAGLRYLELGDTAFAEERYPDAVYFYARAVEFEPDAGMLHLVLADALFATGDYHYGAHEIRKALELEPSLVAAPVDKHLFYADPIDFDRQLAALELFVADHPDDVDARLVLALNQLFGGRPEAAMELMNDAPATSRGLDPAAELIREAADRARWGEDAPVEAGW